MTDKKQKKYIMIFLVIAVLLLLNNVALPMLNTGSVYTAGELPSEICEGSERLASNTEQGHLTYGPYVSVNAGEVSISLSYKTDSNDNYVDVFSYSNDEVYYKSELDSSDDTAEFSFRLPKGVTDLEVRTYYSGNGTLEIDSLTIKTGVTDVYAMVIVYDIVLVVALIFVILSIKNKGKAKKVSTKFNIISELYNYRNMIRNLVKKDLRGRYKGSVLGFLWTFINPLLQLAVYTMVFSIILPSNIEKYYLFLFVALIPWIFFASCLSTGSGIVIAENNLVKKIYFPREVLPVYFVSSCFMNMLYCFVVVIVVVILAGVKISILAWLCLPIIMAVEYILALGITLLLSAVTVYFRDLQHIMGIIAMAWQFLTPVMYPIDIIPERMIPIFMLNPMSPVIIAYRDILYYGNIPSFATLVQATGFGILVLFVGFAVFGKLKKRFAEAL